jgi:hypothetical protein
MSKEKIEAAIVAAADSDFTEFNAKIKDALTDKLEQLTIKIVDMKQNSLFKK